MASPSLLGQALRLQGISEKEFKKCVENLKQNLSRNEVTWLELAEATGLSYQQIYRCKGEIHKDYGIKIVKQVAIEKAIKMKEGILQARKQIKKLVKKLYQAAKEAGVSKDIVNQFDAEVTPLMNKRDKFFESEEVEIENYYELRDVASSKDYEECADLGNKINFLPRKYAYEICQLENQVFFNKVYDTIKQIRRIMKQANIIIKEAVLQIE